jgi:hypothetical protein
MAFDVDALVPVPHAPPRTWFEDVPDWFDPNGALVQVDTESGRVAAIVAPYGECILDGTQNCWTPPQSQTTYEYAHVGTMICDDGSKVRIANVGGGVPHANLTASSSVAADHYANTASRKMIGRYVDSPEKGGILFLGSMWPGTSNRDVIDVVASALSGDWRWIQSLNDYEMVGSQLVNNPGFRPIPGKMPVRASAAFVALRTAMVAGVSDDGPAPVRGVWEPAGVVEVLADKLARVAAVTADLVEDWGDDAELPDAHTAAAPKMKKNVPGVRETWKPKGKGRNPAKKFMVDYGEPKSQKHSLNRMTPGGRPKVKGDGDGDGVPYEAAKRKASAAERRAKKALKGAKRGAVEVPEARVARAKNPLKVVDGDGDGRVKDGTKMERPATPAEMKAGKLLRAAKKLVGGKKGGKDKKDDKKGGAPSAGKPSVPDKPDAKDRDKPSTPKGDAPDTKAAKAKIDKIKADGKKREASRKSGKMESRSLTESQMEYEDYRDAVNASQPEPRSNDELADVSPIDMTDDEIDQIGLDEAMKRLNNRSGRRGKDAGVVRDTDEANREGSLYSELAAKKRAEGGDKPAGGTMAEKPAGGSTLTPEQKGEMRGKGGPSELSAAALREQLTPEQQDILGDRDLSGITGGSGTKDDPFTVTDLELAAELLILGSADGVADKDKLQIKLERPDEVVTLLDRLQAVAQDARSKGEKAPNYNLCKLTVPGTNLFCTESINRLRTRMPQLGTDSPDPGSEAERLLKEAQDAARAAGEEIPTEISLVPQYLDELENVRGIGVQRGVDLPASRFRASQIELNGGKVAGIMNGFEKHLGVLKDPNATPEAKAEAQKKLDEMRAGIIVTSDGYIVDGHHRWAAIVGLGLDGTDIDMKVDVVDADIVSLLDWSEKWAQGMGSPNKRASLGLPRRPCRSC